MFTTWQSFFGFLIGLAMTLGLLLSPHLMPWGYRLGYHWSVEQTALAAAAAAAVLAAALWIAGRLVRTAQSWKEFRFIAATVLIAAVGNTLFTMLVEFYALPAGWRALVATLGVPVIYGNLTAVAGHISLRQAMANILQGALATMGAGFILAAVIKGW